MILPPFPVPFQAFSLGCLWAYLLPFASRAGWIVPLLLLPPGIIGGIIYRLDRHPCPLLRPLVYRVPGLVPVAAGWCLAVLGLVAGLGGQYAWMAAGRHMPVQSVIPGAWRVAGRLARDLQLRLRQDGSGAVLDLGDPEFTDACGRKLSFPGRSCRIRLSVPSASGGAMDCLAFAGDLAVVSATPGSRQFRLQSVRPGRGPDGARSGMLRMLLEGLQEGAGDEGRFLAALVLGRQDLLSPEDARLFLRTGCVHLVALSGMHISLVLGLAFSLFRRLAGPRAGTVAGLLAVVGLVWLVGPFPSALRALLMCLWVECSRLAGFRVGNREALGLSTLVLNLADPLMLFSVGYQLSCATLYGLCFFQDLLSRSLVPVLRPVLAERLGPGMAAQAGSLPVIVLSGLPWYPQGILATLVLEPLCTVLLALGTLRMTLHALSAWAGGLAAWLCGTFDATLVLPACSLVFGFLRRIGACFLWLP